MRLQIILVLLTVLAITDSWNPLEEVELEEALEDAAKGNKGGKKPKNPVFQKFMETRKKCKNDSTLPCPVCGSDRKIYWNGTCELWDASCNNGNGGEIYVVRGKYCKKTDLEVPPNPMFSEACVKKGNVSVTVSRCEWRPKKCRADDDRKMIHPGKCGECTEENVCPEMLKKMKWKKCGEDDYENRCEFLVARCEQFKSENKIIMREKCDEESMEVPESADAKKEGKKGKKRPERLLGRDVARKFRQAKKTCKEGNGTCPICGSDRKMYWNGACELHNASCAAGSDIYPVHPKHCFFKYPVPADKFASEFCVKDGNGSKTMTRCEKSTVKCGGSRVKVIHPGKCGDCSEDNVCPPVSKEIKKKKKKCPFYATNCEYLTDRCEAYKLTKVIYNCTRLSASPSPVAPTTPEPVATTAAPEATTAAPEATTAAPEVSTPEPNSDDMEDLEDLGDPLTSEFEDPDIMILENDGF